MSAFPALEKKLDEFFIGQALELSRHDIIERPERAEGETQALRDDVAEPSLYHGLITSGLFKFVDLVMIKPVIVGDLVP